MGCEKKKQTESLFFCKSILWLLIVCCFFGSSAQGKETKSKANAVYQEYRLDPKRQVRQNGSKSNVTPKMSYSDLQHQVKVKNTIQSKDYDIPSLPLATQRKWLIKTLILRHKFVVNNLRVESQNNASIDTQSGTSNLTYGVSGRALSQHFYHKTGFGFMKLKSVRYHVRFGAFGRTIFPDAPTNKTVPVVNYGIGIEFYKRKIYFGTDIGGTHTFNLHKEEGYDLVLQRGAAIRLLGGYYYNNQLGMTRKFYGILQLLIGENTVDDAFVFGIQGGFGTILQLSKHVSILMEARFGTIFEKNSDGMQRGALVVVPTLNLRFAF